MVRERDRENKIYFSWLLLWQKYIYPRAILDKLYRMMERVQIESDREKKRMR